MTITNVDTPVDTTSSIVESPSVMVFSVNFAENIGEAAVISNVPEPVNSFGMPGSFPTQNVLSAPSDCGLNLDSPSILMFSSYDIQLGESAGGLMVADSFPASPNYVSSNYVPLPNVDVTSDEAFPFQLDPPDAFESNPEIVKAELSFYSTPHTEDFGESVYSTLKAIEQNCAADYVNMCAAPAVDPVDSFDFFRRKALDKVQAVTKGKHTMTYGNVIKADAAAPQTTYKTRVNDVHNLRGKVGLSRRQLFSIFGGKDVKGTGGPGHYDGNHGDHRDHGDHGDHGDGRQGPPPGRPRGPTPGPPDAGSDEPAPAVDLPETDVGDLPVWNAPDTDISVPSVPLAPGGPPPRPDGPGPGPGPPRPDDHHHHAPWSPGSRDEDHDSDSDEEDEKDRHNHHDHDHHDHHGHHDHWGPPPPPIEEDYLFVGSLGYGDAGDMCVYQNFEKLAPQCQSSVADLHLLRKQYWEEEAAMKHHFPHRGPPGCLWLLMWGLIPLAIGLASRHRLRKCRQHKKDMRAIITALEANPALKAQLEVESGVAIPKLSNNDVCERRCSRLVYVLLVGVAAYFAATIMVIVSAVMVFLTVGVAPENPHLTPMVFVGAMLVQLLCLVVGLSRVWRKRNAQAAAAAAAAGGGGDGGHAPSAPTATAVMMASAQGGAGGEAEAKSTFSISTTTTQVTAPVGVFASVRNAITGMTQGLTASPADGAYSALSADESVHGHHPSMAVVTGVPVSSPITAQQQGTTHWI